MDEKTVTIKLADLTDEKLVRLAALCRARYGADHPITGAVRDEQTRRRITKDLAMLLAVLEDMP